MVRFCILIAVLVFSTGSLWAQYGQITIDNEYSDWAGFSGVSDPIADEDLQLDLTEIRVANNEQYLYFKIKIDDGGTGQQFGDAADNEEIDIYIDADNNPATGALVGPAGFQIGAEYTIAAARCTASGLRWASNLYSGIRNASGGGTVIANYGNGGLADSTILTGVTKFEEKVLLNALGLSSGSTFSYVAWTNKRVGDLAVSCDWLNVPQTYTVASVPGPNLDQSNYAKIALDTYFGDWDSVPRIFERDGDQILYGIVPGQVDLGALAFANDLSNLYFYIHLTEYQQFGGTNRVHYLDAFIDIDNNPATGTLIGPTGNQIGADWTVSASRRTSSGSLTASALYYGVHSGIGGGGTYTGFNDKGGVPATTITSNVYQIEERMPLDLTSYAGPILQTGDTVKIVLRAQNSGTAPGPDSDWFDYAVTYTIAEKPLVCGDWGYAAGDVNRDCYTDMKDLFELCRSWLHSTNPVP